jgi:curved DNA-binding protein CbpA
MERRSVPDYYDVLQVSPRAHPVIIAKAYRLLAVFYHPDNKKTGDQEAFKQLVEAYRVLSDPVRRGAYDREKFAAAARKTDPWAANGDLRSLADRRPGGEREIRDLILRSLYDVRRSRPYRPGLSLLALSELLGCRIEDMEFSLWYLKAKRLIETIEDSDLAITVVGVDYLEENGADAEQKPPDIPSLPREILRPDARRKGE